MRRSEERILTTHTGSLPRPPELTRLYVRRARGESVVRRGFLLQLDYPDLALKRHLSYQDWPLGEFLGFVDRLSGRST